MPKLKPPNEKQQQKINELKSLAQSFRAEIPSGRSPWPACIRECVFELAESGLVIPFRDFRIEGLTAKELIELLPLVLGSKDFNS